MLVIKINEKEEYSYQGYHSSWPTQRITVETQHALDNYIQSYGIKKGTIVCIEYAKKPIESYAQLFVVDKVKDKLEDFKSHFERTEPISCIHIRQLGEYQAPPRHLSDNGWERWENPKCLVLLTEDERKEWIDDKVQAKLQEWGLAP